MSLGCIRTFVIFCLLTKLSDISLWQYIGAFFLSLYVGIVFSILVTLCIFLIVGIPYCCRFFTYRRSNENQELACSENDGVSPKKSSQTLVSEFPGGGGPPTNNKKHTLAKLFSYTGRFLNVLPNDSTKTIISTRQQTATDWTT